MSLRMNVFQSFSSNSPKRLAVKLTSKGEKFVFNGHPWIFSNSIQKINKTPQTGDLAVIFRKSDNKLIGLGLYDAESEIRIKMLYHGMQTVQINEHFFHSRIDRAFLKRGPLLETDTDSYRLIYGESDGFPGFIADVYAQVLVIKLYSEIWLPYLHLFIEYLAHVSNTKTIVLRLSRNLQNQKSKGLRDGDVIYGHLHNEVVIFKEHGIRFSANVIKGHKTGYFLDHRHNRKIVGELSKGKTVLDVFAYAGGFSVHALANGALSVSSVDISMQALETARFNVGLNQHKGDHKVIVGDAFLELNSMIDENQMFDIVVIDPPSFAKRQSEIPLAQKKYRQLAQLGAQLTRHKGLLVLASCSSRVTQDDFQELILEALDTTPYHFDLVKSTDHDLDHPIGFKEAAYLKTFYFMKG